MQKSAVKTARGRRCISIAGFGDVRVGDIPALSDDRLASLRAANEKHLASIKLQIEQAKALVKERREYSDPQWFHSLNRVRQLYGFVHQQILNEAARRKDLRKAANVANGKIGSETYLWAFRKHAIALLSPEEYEMVHLSAKAEQDAAMAKQAADADVLTVAA